MKINGLTIARRYTQLINMKIIRQLMMLLIPILTLGQSTELSMFDNLIGKTWKAEGNWGDGSKFSQEIDINYSLDGSIVVSESIGFVDKEQTKLGIRNHGIRQFDKKSNTVKFWEFEVFGELTEGIVFSEGKNLVYQYNYGDSKVTDLWEYVNDSTYHFKVGEYKNGQWIQTYLTTQFKEINKLDIEDIYSIAKNNLIGNWTSPAWDGQLNESWSIDKNGHITQSAKYIENQKVLFESRNKMEIVKNDLILFTLIKDSNPKIFKATSWSKDSITFENSDYKNPNKVTYKFLSNSEFHRRISGMENNELTTYTFMFKTLK